MPRKRMIDPALWTDLDVGRLSRDARLLLIGLISNADDEGRIEADPRQLRRVIFGYDEDVTSSMVTDWLNEIVTTLRSVETYEVDGRGYLHFLKWTEYQKVKFPTASKLPGPIPVHITVIPADTIEQAAVQVTGILRSVDKPAFNEEKITVDRVRNVLAAYPLVDHVAEALAAADWQNDGAGKSKRYSDPIAYYRNWVKRASEKQPAAQQDDVSPRLRVARAV